MPDALAEMRTAVLAAELPAGTTCSAKFPTEAITVPHVHVRWDGTSDATNREDAAVGVTVWMPRNRDRDARDVAASLRAYLLAWSSADCWRVDRGAGRLPGVDPDTGLPFCTFTVIPVLHAEPTPAS